MKRASRFLLIAAVLMLVMLTSVATAFSSSGETVRIFVEYTEGHKSDVSNALNAANAQFHYEFDGLNSFVVTVPAAAVNGIQHNPHVVGIEEDVPRYPIASSPAEAYAAAMDSIDANGQTIPYGIDAVQARDVWDADRDTVVDTGAPTGAGITVCIIDTGYYAAHEDLSSVTTVGGYSQVDDEWARDGYGHGTHVAGTISAANNSVGVVGVTPGTVDFYIVKYFNDAGSATLASDLVDATNRCADAGADIISMSLGGTRSSNQEMRNFETLYGLGVLSIAAAGNDGNTAYSYPASYDTVMSVAAIDENNVVADFSQQNDQVEIAAPGVAVLSTLPFIEANSLTVDGVEYVANHVEYSALGTASGALVDGGLCTTTGDWAGMIVLCQRGDISFYDKVMNVQNSGGAAAIIYNNEPGNFFGTLGEGFSSDIVGISLSMEDGQYLVANKLGVTATVESSYTWPASGYQAWNGTSMATPHVSGVAALIWSANPSWTNAEIREAMTATAVDLGAAGRDVAYGYGLVQAYDALQYLGGGEPVDNPPVVDITSPASGTSVETGTAVSFAGTATDDFDGDLTAGLVWTSDLDGTIGTGGSFSVVLSEGTHTITASVTDSASNVGSDTVTVTVSSGGTGGVLDVLVETSAPVYYDREYVVVYVTVTDGGAPVAGATVDLTLTFPILTAGGTSLTDASGVAAFSYRLNVRKAGTGTAYADAVVTMAGYETATGSTTFSVQ